MPNPNSGILDLRNGGAPSLVPDRLPGWRQAAGPRLDLGNAIREAAMRFLAWRARQATLYALSKLDAATLRDLGITDIEAAAFDSPHDRVRGCDPDLWRARPM